MVFTFRARFCMVKFGPCLVRSKTFDFTSHLQVTQCFPVIPLYLCTGSNAFVCMFVKYFRFFSEKRPDMMFVSASCCAVPLASSFYFANAVRNVDKHCRDWVFLFLPTILTPLLPLSSCALFVFQWSTNTASLFFFIYICFLAQVVLFYLGFTNKI